MCIYNFPVFTYSLAFYQSHSFQCADMAFNHPSFSLSSQFINAFFLGISFHPKFLAFVLWSLDLSIPIHFDHSRRTLHSQLLGIVNFLLWWLCAFLRLRCISFPVASPSILHSPSSILQLCSAWPCLVNSIMSVLVRPLVFVFRLRHRRLPFLCFIPSHVYICVPSLLFSFFFPYIRSPFQVDFLLALSLVYLQNFPLSIAQLQFNQMNFRYFR